MSRDDLRRPLPLAYHPLYRFYEGGALTRQFRGLPERPDDWWSEDWVGSCTCAGNPDPDGRVQGLSTVDLPSGQVTLKSLADAWPEEMGDASVLVKLLSPSGPVPLHAHPTRAWARRHLGSPFGKTEAWIVLATREEHADVWIGPREPVDAATYRAWIEAQDLDALLGSLHRVPVRAGDVIYVPAGVPHSIGAGVLIAELQEPTDFSIVCEWQGFPIDPDDTHLGMGWDVALGAFDLRAHKPVRVLPEEAREFFWADDNPSPAGRFAIWIVTAGEGEIDGMPARAGDTLAVPAAVDNVRVTGGLEILRCLGPA